LDKRIIGQQRDHAGLLLIHNSGWMRAKELGRILWPKSRRPAVNASELIAKWKRAGWVLVRSLPNNMGRALVLSAAGAGYLRAAGCSDAVTGKDWGETRAGKWIAPRTWQHELLTLGLLAQLSADGWQVIPERQLRRENSPGKFPDGLAIRGSTVLWIEVENSRKTGAHCNHMLQALILASRGQGESLSGYGANGALLAYAIGATDERGYSLDHRQHVVTALARRSPVDVPLMLAALTIAGTAGVSQVAFEKITVESDAVSHLTKSIPWQTCAESEGFHAYEYFTDNDFEYRHGNGDGSWWWSIYQEKSEIAAADVSSADEARRALVGEYCFRANC
jgi:hypothetical protein